MRHAERARLARVLQRWRRRAGPAGRRRLSAVSLGGEGALGLRQSPRNLAASLCLCDPDPALCIERLPSTTLTTQRAHRIVSRPVRAPWKCRGMSTSPATRATHLWCCTSFPGAVRWRSGTQQPRPGNRSLRRFRLVSNLPPRSPRDSGSSRRYRRSSQDASVFVLPPSR